MWAVSLSSVDLGRDFSQSFGAMKIQVGALGEVLANEPVCVLVRASLSRLMWIAEVDRDRRFLLELKVLDLLRSLIPRQRFPEVRRQGAVGAQRCSGGFFATPFDTGWPQSALPAPTLRSSSQRFADTSGSSRSASSSFAAMPIRCRRELRWSFNSRAATSHWP